MSQDPTGAVPVDYDAQAALEAYYDALANYEEGCREQEANLRASMVFLAIWSLMLLLWLLIVVRAIASSCSGVRRCCSVPLLQWIMFIVPGFHLGDQIWQVYTYTTCTCLHCSFHSWSQHYTWLGLHYVFNVGRFVALLLCIFLIATGVSTVRSRLMARQWLSVVVLFGGLTAMLTLSLPLIREALAIGPDSSTTIFQCSLAFYVAIVIAVYVEAFSNARVLKAQLMMFRSQGIAPRGSPAYYKFRLFTRLRRYIFFYFILHTSSLLTQVMDLALRERIILICVWETVQIGVTASIGLLFKSSSGTGRNPYLAREDHLPASQVRQPMAAEDVSLGWDDLRSVIAERDETNVAADARADNSRRGAEGESQPLMQPWQEGMAVPAPPTPPAILSVFVGRRRDRMRRIATARRSRTRPSEGVVDV